MIATVYQRLRALHKRRHDEDGTTLMELVVGMAIMAIFLGIFSGSLYLMGSTVAKVGAVSDAAAQTNKAFLALDKSIRYASAISTPAKSATSSDWHVEFNTSQTVNGTSAGSTSDQCTQLRIHSNQLQQRTWTVSGATYLSGSLTSWTPLASYITNGSASTTDSNRPFVAVTSTTAASAFQQLTVTLTATAGNSSTSTNTSVMTFAAVNSSATSSTTPCQQVGVDAAS